MPSSDAEGTRDTLVGEPIGVEGCAYDLIKQAAALLARFAFPSVRERLTKLSRDGK